MVISSFALMAFFADTILLVSPRALETSRRSYSAKESGIRESRFFYVESRIEEVRVTRILMS